MSFDDIQTASIIRYPYLWVREAEQGETEGRKHRPVAVGVRIARADGDVLLLFPVTTKEPKKGPVRCRNSRYGKTPGRPRSRSSALDHPRRV